MRAAGAVTVMVCSILAGIYLSVCERRALSALSELCGLFSYLRECVCERLMPTDVAVRSSPFDVDAEIYEKHGLYAALSDRVVYLSDKERLAGRSFCDALGRGSASSQAASLGAACASLGAFMKKRSEAAEKGPGVYVAVSVFIGACAVIIFI
jgi:hypothetical protein